MAGKCSLTPLHWDIDDLVSSSHSVKLLVATLGNLVNGNCCTLGREHGNDARIGISERYVRGCQKLDSMVRRTAFKSDL